MIKLAKHTIYEVWNEMSGESVYFTHKPSKKDIHFAIKQSDWYTMSAYYGDLNDFIKKYIHVNKLPHVYEHVCECGICNGGVQ